MRHGQRRSDCHSGAAIKSRADPNEEDRQLI